jgi:hypothetical protein
MISLVLPKVARARLRTHPSPSHQAKQKLLQGLRLRPGVAGQKRFTWSADYTGPVSVRPATQHRLSTEICVICTICESFSAYPKHCRRYESDSIARSISGRQSREDKTV